jgi:aprataxin
MANLYILRNYAQKSHTELPSSILFSHSAETLTIYDAYPKSIFHFLILPRVKPDSELTVNDLESLKSLLADKTRAKQVIDALNDDAKSLHEEIEEEMVKRYGFKWLVCARPTLHKVDGVSNFPLGQYGRAFMELRLCSTNAFL